MEKLIHIRLDPRIYRLSLIDKPLTERRSRVDGTFWKFEMGKDILKLLNNIFLIIDFIGIKGQ